VKPVHIKTKRKKEVRRILRRQQAIQQEIIALGYMPLDKPLRHGWFKEIVVSSKIERYKNQAYILEILKVCPNFFWGGSKEKVEKSWEELISQNLIYNNFPTFCKAEFDQLSPKAKSLCSPYHFRDEEKKMQLRYAIKLPKGAYRKKYTRAYITESKRMDPSLEMEYDLLNQQLLKSGFFEANIARYRWIDYWNLTLVEKENNKTKRILKSLCRYPLKDIHNEDSLWEIN